MSTTGRALATACRPSLSVVIHAAAFAQQPADGSRETGPQVEKTERETFPDRSAARTIRFPARKVLVAGVLRKGIGPRLGATSAGH